MPSSAFWPALHAGLTAPLSIYAPAPRYDLLVVSPGPAESMAAVGGLLNQSSNRMRASGRARRPR
jgi:hypothetical protein